MSTTTSSRTDQRTTPLLALVGVTDLVVERARAAREQAEQRAERLASGLRPERLQTQAQQVPTVVVTKALDAAGKAEESYTDLVKRGEQLVERVRRQRATQDLVTQGKVTLSRTRAAVTTARRAAEDTTAAAASTLGIARRDAAATATEARREAPEVVAQKTAEVAEAARRSTAKRTTPTKQAAAKTTTTARKRTSTAKSTTKAAATSARKTAEKAATAAEATAEKVGD